MLGHHPQQTKDENGYGNFKSIEQFLHRLIIDRARTSFFFWGSPSNIQVVGNAYIATDEMDQPTETGITCQRCRLCSKVPKRE